MPINLFVILHMRFLFDKLVRLLVCVIWTYQTFDILMTD